MMNVRASKTNWFPALVALLSVLSLLPAAAEAQPGPDGIDWVTVGAPGNRAYDGPDPFDLVAGRGSVGYEYRIGRTEVTTEQWLNFFNAALARPDPLPFTNLLWAQPPILWGAIRDTTYTGPGTRYRLNPSIPNAGMLPAGGVSWRMSAVLCNWLENNKNTDASAFMSGAYDVTTFSPGTPTTTFNDQQAHTPTSRYWIPTLDEWMKAVHYDPNANGGSGRWWQQPNGTDTPLIYAPPPPFGGDGTGQANSGFRLPGDLQYQIPLGSYPMTVSPWGVMDAAGGTAEWLETIRVPSDRMTRGLDGSVWGAGNNVGDEAFSWGQVAPHLRLTSNGLRLASTVPAPSSVLVVLSLCGVFSRHRRKESTHA